MLRHRLITYVTVLFLGFHTGLTQILGMDSLNRALNATSDSVDKLNLYVRLADEYMDVNIRQVPPFLDSAKAISNAENDKKSQGKVYQLSGIERWLNGYYREAENQLHQAIGMHRILGDTFNVARDYSYLGLVFHYQASHDSALHYHHLALELNRRLDLKNRIAHNLDNIALTHHQLGNFKEVIQYTTEALYIRSNIQGYVTRTNFYNYGGRVFIQKAFDEAIRYHMNVLQEEMASGSVPEKIGLSLNNLGSTYYSVGMYDSAVYYLRKSAEIIKETGVFNRYAGHLNELGEALFADKQFKEAEKVFTEAMHIWDSVGTRISRSIVKCNLAEVFLKMEKLNTGMKLMDEAYQMAGEMSHNAFFSKTGYIRAGYLLLMREPRQALSQAKLALENALRIRVQDKILDGYSLMGEIYEALDQPGKSLDYLKLYIGLNERLYNAEGSLQLARMQITYETEKKTREIEMLQAENQFKSVALQQRNLIISLSLGMVLILVGLVFNRYRYIRKLAMQKKVIEKQKDYLEAANRGKELMLSETHHRVKNNLQIIISMLNLQSRKATNELVRKELKRNKDRLSAMAIIHQQLYKKDQNEKVDLKDYLQSLVHQIKSSCWNDQQKINLELNLKRIKVDFDMAISIGLIVNELVSNSMKHAFHKVECPALGISLKRDIDYLILNIKDNGRSYDKGENNSGKGFGLRLVRSLVKELQGKIKTDSAKGVETTIMFKA